MRPTVPGAGIRTQGGSVRGVPASRPRRVRRDGGYSGRSSSKRRRFELEALGEAVVTSSIRKASAVIGSPLLRLAVLLAGLVIALAAGLWLGHAPPLLDVHRWRDEGGPWAPLLFVLFFGVAALVFAPRPALSALAGMLFTLPVALLVVLTGTVLGAGLAFGIARLLGRDAIAPRLRAGRLQKLDSVFAHRGFTATVICRLLPVLPYSVVNYGAGITQVGLVPFLAGTAVGTLPANLVYITAGNALVAGTTWQIMMWLALAAAVLVAAGWAARTSSLAKKRAWSESRTL